MRPALLRLALAWTASCGLATLAAAANPDLQHCRAIGNDQERLACYDAAAASPSAASPSPASASPGSAAPASAVPAEAATASTATGAPSDNKSSGEEDFGKQRTDEEKAAPQDLRSAVASVQTDASGKLILGLENGQTWAQIDSASLKLKPGDPVVIRRGFLGSFLLARVTGGPEIRVRRR